MDRAQAKRQAYRSLAKGQRPIDRGQWTGQQANGQDTGQFGLLKCRVC